MGKSLEFNIDSVYSAWRTYLLAHSAAKYFGMIFDPTKQSKFPYANLKMLSRSTQGSDFENDEMSIQLTFEAEGYINNNKYDTVLYGIDAASADFFLELGFKRVGDSSILKVSDTVTKISSRFVLQNYCGYFLKELGSF